MEQFDLGFFRLNMIKRNVVLSSDQRPPFSVSRFLTLETGRESEVIDMSKRKGRIFSLFLRIKGIVISLNIRK